MNFVRGMLFGNKGEEEVKEEPADVEEVEVEDLLGKYMPESMTEDMLCFSMSDCKLYQLKPKGGKQFQQCEFIDTSIGFSSARIPKGTPDGAQVQIPMVVASNEDYDKDQDQQMEEKLPMSEEMIFMRYDVAADDESEDESAPSLDYSERNSTVGFVFFYPTLDNLCRVIEVEITDEDKASECQEFQDWVCKMIYIFNDKKQIRVSKNT